MLNLVEIEYFIIRLMKKALLFWVFGYRYTQTDSTERASEAMREANRILRQET